SPTIEFRSKSRPSLRPSGAAEALRRLPGGFECRRGVLRGHRDGRLDIGQTAARGSSQYRRGGGLLVGELADGHPIMMAKGQVPPDELAAQALVELADGFLAIFRLGEHALDGVRRETPA